MTEKFKKKRGAPTKPPGQLRPDLRTKVSPSTKRWLDAERNKIGTPYGVSIDKLVQEKIDKLDYDTTG